MVLLPTGKDLVHDVNVREFFHRTFEPVVTIRVCRHAGNAAHVNNIAFGRYARINGYYNDILCHCCVQRRIQGIGVGRVQYDCIDTRLDQVVYVFKLACAIGIAVGHDDISDMGFDKRLRTHRADHLFTPAVALHGVGHSNRV